MMPARMEVERGDAAAGAAGDGSGVLSTASCSRGLRKTRWLSFVITCLAAFPLMAIGKLVMKPEQATLSVNDPRFWLPYDTSSQLPFITVYIWAGPLALFLIACELFAWWRVARADDRVALGLQAALAYLEGCFVNAAITEMLKGAFGIMRPDFQDRCVGVAYPSLVNETAGTAIDECTSGENSRINDGLRAFPSGHQSMAMAVAWFVTLYIVWATHARRRGGSGVDSRCAAETRHAMGVVALLPMVWAFWVGVTRVHDHRHHASDIVMGVVIGLMASSLSFWRFTMVAYGPLGCTNGKPLLGGGRAMGSTANPLAS